MSQKPQEPARPSAKGPVGPKPGAGGPKTGPAPKAGVRSDVERAMALRDVMDHAVRFEKETTGPTLFRNSHARAILIAVICVPLLAFSAYSWIARPEFIWGPRPAPPPAAQQEAAMRFSMFLLAQRVNAFRHSRGSLPASLQDLGESLPGATYAVVSDTVFELRAVVDGKPVVYRSNQPADDFLGSTTNIIQGLVPK